MKIYGAEIKTKEDMLEEMASSLSGTCMQSIEGIMNDEEYSVGIKHFSITEDEFITYLDCAGIFECATCGWWTYSGEGNGVNCDQCECEEEAEDE
jgi:hypothetical protein